MHTVYIHIIIVHVRVQTVPKYIQCTVVHTCTYTFCTSTCIYVYKQYQSTYTYLYVYVYILTACSVVHTYIHVHIHLLIHVRVCMCVFHNSHVHSHMCIADPQTYEHIDLSAFTVYMFTDSSISGSSAVVGIRDDLFGQFHTHRLRPPIDLQGDCSL